MRLYFAFAALLTFTACCPSREILRETIIRDSISIDSVLVPILVPADTASLTATLMAYRDSLDQCRVLPFSYQATSNRATVYVAYDGDLLTVRAACDSMVYDYWAQVKTFHRYERQMIQDTIIKAAPGMSRWAVFWRQFGDHLVGGCIGFAAAILIMTAKRFV